MKVFIIIVFILLVLIVIALSSSLSYFVGVSEGKKRVSIEFSKLIESVGQNGAKKNPEPESDPDPVDVENNANE